MTREVVIATLQKRQHGPWDHVDGAAEDRRQAMPQPIETGKVDQRTHSGA